MTKYAFIFADSFAITVEPFVVLDPHSGDENGARIEVRRVDAGGTEPGTHLAETVWRGDLRGLADRAAAPDLVAASVDLQPQVDAVQDELRLALQKCAAARPA